MEKYLLVKLYFLDLLMRNFRCIRKLAELVGADLHKGVMFYLCYSYIVVALEYTQGHRGGLSKHCSFSNYELNIDGEKVIIDELVMDEHKDVFIKTPDGRMVELTPPYCTYEMVDQMALSLPPVQWDDFFCPRANFYSAGIPNGHPELKAIATPEFTIDLDTPAHTMSPAQTLYKTLYLGIVPSQQEVLALLEQLTGFHDDNKFWFNEPVCIRLFAGAKKLKHVIFGICLNENAELAPMGKKGEALPVLLEDCPAFILADVFDAARRTGPLERYSQRNLNGEVNCLEGGEAESEEDYQEKQENYIKEAYAILEQDIRYAKGHPELHLLVKKDLSYQSWYPIIYHMADAAPVTLQDGICLMGFTDDCCPRILYHGNLGYLPSYPDAETGFIVALLEGPLKNKLIRSARYYSPNPGGFYDRKMNEVLKQLNNSDSSASQWAKYIRCEGCGPLPEDTDAAASLPVKDQLDHLRRSIKTLSFHYRMIVLDLETMRMNFIRTFIDLYGVKGRINVFQIPLEGDDVCYALQFRDAPDYNYPGRVVTIRKVDFDDKDVPSVEYEFERPLLRDSGKVDRLIYTAGENSTRISYLYWLLLKIHQHPGSYIIENGAIRPAKKK